MAEEPASRKAPTPAQDVQATAAVPDPSRGPTAPRPHRGVALGAMLGKYRISAILGRGGMGNVYAATDPVIQRQVAIKMLPPELAEDAPALNRFLAEAQAVGKLNHPNVVTIHEVVQFDGSYAIVMELVPGGSVADYLARKGPPGWKASTRIIGEACKALAAAHDKGLIHRDIKPANLLLTAEGHVKVADFGLAKMDGGEASVKTQAGALLGTPAFMSPEQCRGDTLDGRTDIYSLGCTYFAMLTGKAPFEAATSMQVMFAHCSAPIPNPRDLSADVPEPVTMIVAKALAKNPQERYGDAREMLADLRAVLGGGALTIPAGNAPKARSRRRLWVGAGAAIAAAVALLTVFMHRTVPDFSRTSPLPNSGVSLKPVVQPRAAAQAVASPVIVNSIGMKLMLIKPGRFRMGDASLADAPPHEVTISQPFYLGADDVTLGQWGQIFGNTPRRPDMPVFRVGWLQATRFCRLLNAQPAEQQAGRIYRLPTEAEWEYACRAGTTTRYAFGDQLTASLANFGKKTVPGGQTMFVQHGGMYPPNAWGLYDMQGNLWQWCSDFYAPTYDTSHTAIDPTGPTSGTAHVARGGSWNSTAQQCASAYRCGNAVDLVGKLQVGFRVVCIAIK